MWTYRSITKDFSMRVLLLSILLLTSLTVVGQKPKQAFLGVLEYKISIRDTSLRAMIPDNHMIFYSNDTISRMENFTDALGKQVRIRHMQLNKSYLLLETGAGKFAIKSDLDNKQDTTGGNGRYTFKKKLGKKKILGLKAKRMIVSHPAFEEPIEFLYLHKYDNKYLNNFSAIPGIVVKYSVVTPDGTLDYELTRFTQYTPDRDLFGIPSDYEKVTIDEFMERVTGNGEPQPNSPENGN